MSGNFAIARCTRRIFRVRVGGGTAAGCSYLPSDPGFPGEPDGAVAGPAVTWSGERIELRDAAGAPLLRLLTSPAPSAPNSVRLRFEVVGEQHFYGLGHGGQPFDRLGATRRLWNCHVNHGGGSDIAIPLLLSHRGYAVLFDCTAGALFDPADSGDAVRFDYTVAAAGLDVFLLCADDPRGVMAEVANLLGRAPLPPRWALGYLQSTRHVAATGDYDELAAGFRERGLPCDGIVLLSTYGAAQGWNRGVGHLEPREPGFAALVDRLHARDLHVVTHEYPVLHAASPCHAEAAAKHYLAAEGYPEVAPAERTATSYHDGQRYLDFARPEVGDWWWDRHAALVAAGVDGWWLDGGEGPQSPCDAHNRYDLDRQAAFAAGEARDRPQRRPFLLCRSGGAGMQRFGAACWSGDVNNSFAALEAQIALGLNLGLSGVPFWGTDIGGYYPSAPEDGELFARWFQFAAFTPVFRAHGRAWRERLPWSFGPEIEAICRRYLELRYRLMPYSYGVAWQAHRRGLPMMRPLVLDHADDPNVWDSAVSYMWGDDILVAPVTRAAAAHWPVYLPRGRWCDFWTGEAHDGGRAVSVAAPLERLPLFVRAGAVIPMGPVQQHATPRGPAELTLLLHPGAASRSVLYEDDGMTGDYRHGGGVTTGFASEMGDGALTLRIAQPVGDLSLLPADRRYRVHIAATRSPRFVRINGETDAPPWSHDGERALCIAVPRHPATLTVGW